MITLQIKELVKEEKQKEIKIETPFYCKDGICFWYKVVDEKRCIQLKEAGERIGIEVAHAELPFNVGGPIIEIGQDEFNLQFKKIIKLLSK